MKVMKWSAIALAVSAGSTQFAVADAFVSDQAEAKGFIEDSSLDLLLRNYYFNRDGKRRVSEILCNRLMSDTVAENWRHHEQDAPHHYRRTAGSASGQLS
ncbi:OprD family outer membrane porin, partial [Pseudomonas aeruginosa]